MDENSGLQYGEDYLSWKNWKNESFGSCSPQKAAYYDALLSKTKMQLSNIRVLEIGFGDGDFMAYARKKGWEISGLEMSQELITIAASKGYEVYQAEEINNLDENQFDIVVAFDVLEHVQQTDLAGFLDRVRDLLKSGGLFLAKFPNGDSPLGLACQNGDMTHVTIIGSGKVAYLAEKCGFEVKHMGGETKPIFCKSMAVSGKRMISTPIKMFLELFIHVILHPKTNARMSFLSENLEIVLKKRS